jgi:hypothetical protein
VWKARGENRSKRPKTQQAAKKVIASVLGNALGLITIDYLEKGVTINRKYYITLLVRLKRKTT